MYVYNINNICNNTYIMLERDDTIIIGVGGMMPHVNYYSLRS